MVTTAEGQESLTDGAFLEIFRRSPVGDVARLAAVGDVTTSGRVAPHFAGAGGAAHWDVWGALEAADLAFANLECVVGDGNTERPFTIDAASIADFRDAGLDVLNLANNHVLDRGAAGLEATVRAVETAGLMAVGVGTSGTDLETPVRTDRNGLRIGWLAAARTLADQSASQWRIWELDEAALVAAIRRARGELDVVVVSLHTGYMLVEYPAPELRAMALRLAAAGADLILMHHPHVLQGVEVTAEGRVICFSLGNFLFDWREGDISTLVVEDLQRQGGIFTFELDRKGVASAIFEPTVLDDDCRVVLPSADLAARICDRVARLSRELAEDYAPRFQQQRAERNTALGAKMLLQLLRSGRIGDLTEHLRRLRPHHLGMAWRWLTGRVASGRSL